MKAFTALVAMLLLSTVLLDPGGCELRARVAAPSGPFSPSVIINDNKANDQAQPVLVSLPGGGLVAIWQDERSGAINPDIYVSKSVDNGTSWGPNRRADDSTTVSEQKEPAAAVSANGTLYIVWEDYRRGALDPNIFLTKSYDGGATFTKNVWVDDSFGTNSWQLWPSIAVTPGGGVYVAWTDDRTGSLRIRGAYSVDGGMTFSPSKEIVANGSTSGQAEVAMVSNCNRLFAAFMDNITGWSHPYLAVSSNGGKSFGAPIRLDSLGSRVVLQRGLAIAPIPGGGVVVAWEDSRDGNWGTQHIYACIVSQQGAITTPDFRVDDCAVLDSQEEPSVAVDQLGNIHAAWTDCKDGSSAAIRFAYMEEGASQFNASIEVATPNPNDFQGSPSIVAPAPGQVFVIWQDDRANTYDIYSSGAFFPELFEIFLGLGWNLVSIPSTGCNYTASTLGLKTGDMVVQFNTTTQKYTKMFIVGVSPPSVDFPIESSTGYWINTRAHERFKLNGSVPTSRQSRDIVIPSGGGWATVGFESLNTTRYASDIPSMLNDSRSINAVTSYDTYTGKYKTYVPGVPPSDFVLAPGHAYLCHFLYGVTLTYFP